MSKPSMRRAAVALAWAACTCAHAHPHGEMECRADVDIRQGSLQRIDAELRMDAANSESALSLVRDPADGTLDAERVKRFAFALRMQLGRWGWLFDLSTGGQCPQTNVIARPAP